MTFKLADPEALYRVEVPVDVPQPDGSFEEQTFTALFRLVETNVWTGAALDSDEAFLKAVLAGWEGIADADGSPLQWSDEMVEKLAGQGYWARAVHAAYHRWAAALPGKTSAQLLAAGAAVRQAATT